MKQFLLLPVLLFSLLSTLSAQTTMGPVETQLTNNICDCINKLDMEKINDKASAEKAFMGCFSKDASLILKVAEERNVELTDQAAMRVLGTDIAKNLMRQDCKGFLPLSLAMAGNSVDEAENTGETEGQLKRIETKDFNYFVVEDASKKEKSFLWLRQFPGSEEFINNPAKYKGKKLRVEWQDIEVYLPSAKGYYTVKEVTGIELL